MGFMDSYKHLEKLCGDMLGSQHGVSAYIDEMLRKPRGSYLVRGWDDDLNRLKHYRWVRNQISHEPECSEENMCDPKDDDWLNGFYDRIMNQTDPLALYRKAARPKPAAKPARNPMPDQSKDVFSVQSPRPKNSSGKTAAWIVLLILALFIALLFLAKNRIG